MKEESIVSKKQISIVNIEFKESFDQLTEEEKNYLYYLSKACWTGQIIDLFQTSYESPALFMIFQMYFSSFNSVYEIEQIIKKNKEIDIAVFNKFMEYAAKFYSNFGNYTMNKKKFFPEFNNTNKENIQIFQNILSTSPKYKEFESIWDIIKFIIFDKSDDSKNIDLEEKEGKNCYYLGGIKKEQIESADKFLSSKNISLLNTRLFYYDSKVVTLIGSINEEQIDLDVKNTLLYGEFSPFLKKINEYLDKAKEYTTKEAEIDLINDYIDFFKTGNIEKHKESQKKWVQLESQIDRHYYDYIDYNLGWNEVIFDPLNTRGLFEGFVGFIDNFMSQKYEQIINLIPQLIQELPWSQDFNEKIGKIQFKSFKIICFARKGCPYGKSLPNYFEVKKEYGVKNLIFSNVFPNFKESEDNYYYLNQKDKELISNFGQVAIKIVTSLKYLIGFGVGKLFKCEIDTETNELIYNFDRNMINPLTNQILDKYYKENETFEKKFEYNSRLMTECIACLIYLYLCGNEPVQEIFYVNKIDFKKVTQTCWLLFFSRVISSLNLYNEKEKNWTVTQAQAGWIIMNFILSEQKENEEIIKIEIDETNKEQKNFKLNINKELLTDTINDIISKLLQKLYIYKCIGDVESAVELINKYSIIDKEKVIEVKNIIDKEEDNKIFFLFHNLEMVDNKVIYKEYQNNKEGIIQSNLERFGLSFNKDIYNQWVKYATNFLKSK